MSARGIFVVGLNGCGKTTLGRALAERLGWLRLDVEDYYFLDMTLPYANPRSEAEVRRLMAEDIRRHGDFVLSSVRGDMGDEINGLCRLAVWLKAPQAVRLARIERREIARFGSRVLPGGDMYEGQQRFHAMAAARTESMVADSLRALRCPVLTLDAEHTISDNIDLIIKECHLLGITTLP